MSCTGPMESFRRVCFLVPLCNDKSITLQSSRRHEDEYPKCSITEAKAFWERLAMAANQGVDLFNVVIVDIFQFLGQLKVATGKLLKGLWGGHVEKTPELIVAGNSTLPVPQDIDRSQVSD